MMMDRAPDKRPSRRRVLQLAGAGAGMLMAPGAALARGQRYVWQGEALGAAASITLFQEDRARAREIVGACLAEVERLEREFSLYRPDSALVRLNSTGRLEHPGQDMRRILDQAAYFSALSRGRFDVTVQPLWRLYADHFAGHPESISGPPKKALAAARSLVDYRAVDVTPSQVRLMRPGMAISLNGIAQGYITDRVAEVMKDMGIDQVLVNLGEMRALGAKPDGADWRIAIRDPGLEPALSDELAISGEAVATSAGSGTRFSLNTGDHHILDPESGNSARYWSSVTVTAPDATTADALSTALYLTPPGEAQALLRAAGTGTAQVLDASGRRLVLASTDESARMENIGRL